MATFYDAWEDYEVKVRGALKQAARLEQPLTPERAGAIAQQEAGGWTEDYGVMGNWLRGVETEQPEVAARVRDMLTGAIEFTAVAQKTGGNPKPQPWQRAVWPACGLAIGAAAGFFVAGPTGALVHGLTTVAGAALGGVGGAALGAGRRQGKRSDEVTETVAGYIEQLQTVRGRVQSLLVGPQD